MEAAAVPSVLSKRSSWLPRRPCEVVLRLQPSLAVGPWPSGAPPKHSPQVSRSAVSLLFGDLLALGDAPRRALLAVIVLLGPGHQRLPPFLPPFSSRCSLLRAARPLGWVWRVLVVVLGLPNEVFCRRGPPPPLPLGKMIASMVCGGLHTPPTSRFLVLDVIGRGDPSNSSSSKRRRDNVCGAVMSPMNRLPCTLNVLVLPPPHCAE